MQIDIRPMLPADVELGMWLKAEAGWNQVEANWRRAMAIEPEGCFVAEADGQPVGTTTTCTFGPVAWVAMVLVDARFRGAGIGRALLNHALTHLDRRGITSVRLDATPLGRPLYEQLGFVAEYELARFAGRPGSVGVPSLEIQPATADDVDRIASLDFQSSGTDRARLLRYVLADEDSAARVVRSSAGLVGCILDRPGAVAGRSVLAWEPSRQLLALLAKALARNAGQNVYVDIPLASSLPANLRRLMGSSFSDRYCG